jgi:hypothetical protein
MAGVQTMGAKGRDNTAEYLEKTLARRKKTKKIKKNSRRGEAMSAVALEEKSKSTRGSVETAAHAEVT